MKYANKSNVINCIADVIFCIDFLASTAAQLMTQAIKLMTYAAQLMTQAVKLMTHAMQLMM